MASALAMEDMGPAHRSAREFLATAAGDETYGALVDEAFDAGAFANAIIQADRARPADSTARGRADVRTPLARFRRVATRKAGWSVERSRRRRSHQLASPWSARGAAAAGGRIVRGALGAVAGFGRLGLALATPPRPPAG